jgi:tetratricopeptide (TPR) repeat protein
VAEALRQLRQRHDPRAALSTLDRHAREFPKGVLETEAFRTRVEALLQLGDFKAALVALDAAADPDQLGVELLLTRAELRADAGRFRPALADFTELAEPRRGSLGAGRDERVLYGRAVCLGKLGKDASARATLREYRERFPGGRFAPEVERLLGERSPPDP